MKKENEKEYGDTWIWWDVDVLLGKKPKGYDKRMRFYQESKE